MTNKMPSFLFAVLALVSLVGCDSPQVRFAADDETQETEREAEPAEEGDAIDSEADADGEVAVCEGARILRCGDRLTHSTLTEGRGDRWQGYSCTQRYEGGRETLYAFEMQTDCAVELRLSGLRADLDLLVLSECSPWACLKAASTPLDLQDGAETLTFESKAARPLFVVVDGYGEEQGAYTLDVACACLDGDAD